MRKILFGVLIFLLAAPVYADESVTVTIEENSPITRCAFTAIIRTKDEWFDGCGRTEKEAIEGVTKRLVENKPFLSQKNRTYEKQITLPTR
jgi:hypothetical protein